MKKIDAKIVADSINPQGDRITTFLLTFPRFIHSELMTHRMFSRNSASSRAIPFEKMVKMVIEDPFIPVVWQKSHVGMQGSEYLTDIMDIERAEHRWRMSIANNIEQAKVLNDGIGVTKQLCNRLLEPFMWHTVMVTATEWDNFFELRAPKYKLIGLGGNPVRSRKDWLEKMKFSSALHPSQYPQTEEEWWMLSESGAEIHIQALAESMLDAMNESTPKKLEAGEWHYPFYDNFIDSFLKSDVNTLYQKDILKVCTARAARLSYMTFDGEIDYEKDIQLHDKLLADGHMSPFEHCAQVPSQDEYDTSLKGKEKGWFRNYKGFKSYRQILEEC